jgi:uncharacterized protein (TIGR00369 family)
MAKDLPEGAPVMLRMNVERENGYLSWLGVQMESIEYGNATLKIPFDDQFTDQEESPPTVHNGIAATLMEQTGELATRTTMPDPVNDTVEALTMNMNFLNDAAHDMIATGELVEKREGAAVSSVEIESRTPQGSLETIATGQCVYRIE